MYVINKDKLSGIIKISDSYSNDSPIFDQIGDKYTISFIDLTEISKLKSFTYNTIGTIETRYLKATYRISRDSIFWTDWFELSSTISNFPPFDEKDTMFIDIRWERIGDSSIGSIQLKDFVLTGTITRNIVDGESTISLVKGSESLIIKPPYIFKVFKITDLEIISAGDIDQTSIKYRFSQDYGRTVTQWEPLTKDNITTVKITPIRFFQIEYLIEYKGDTNIKIYDINLIGDYQNVTFDSQKTNVYGIRENCNCLMLGLVSDESTNITGIEPSSNMLMGASSCENQLKPLTPDDIAKLFNPYQQNQAVEFLNKLSTDANEVFGHEVVYFLTDPDKTGIDYTFHEYQLYNYVCSDLIKISVDGNNFPDNQIVMNQFDLSLFESFEVHIPKETFKLVFGPEKRPSKEDFLWFCSINRMFQIEHAQQFRNFNNSALYYKVMLKKYSQKSSIIGVNQTIADKVKELTKNSTIDEMFGLENTLDKKDVANEEQFRPLTKDVLRLEINVDIDRELVENATTIISKNNYDLSTVTYQTVGVQYRNFRNLFKKSDNIGFTLWFNINNYTVNDIYNFITYYDNENNIGFKVNLISDRIILTLNSDTYNFDIGTYGEADALEEQTWYCFVINIDQRQRKSQQWIYKRNVEVESEASKLGSTILKKVYTNDIDISPVQFEVENSNVSILGSDMKVTNIRMFNDVIPESTHNKILNQYIIGEDYKYLIFADNANKRLTLPSLPLNQVDYSIIRGERGKENL